MLLAGNIGWGKTNLVMAYATRSMAFGRRIHVPGDPKDDWVRLALAVGGQGIRLGKGLTTAESAGRRRQTRRGRRPELAGHRQVPPPEPAHRPRLHRPPKIAPLDPFAVAAIEVALAAAARRHTNPKLPTSPIASPTSTNRRRPTPATPPTSSRPPDSRSTPS